MKEPAKRADGACLECLGGNLCEYHRHTTQVAWAKRERAIYRAATHLHAEKIARICARYELEPDEFYTVEQKAERLIA